MPFSICLETYTSYKIFLDAYNFRGFIILMMQIIPQTPPPQFKIYTWLTSLVSSNGNCLFQGAENDNFCFHQEEASDFAAERSFTHSGGATTGVEVSIFIS